MLSQQLLTSICGRNNVRDRNNSEDNDIPEETRKKFDQWYLQQVFNHYRQVATLAAAQQQHSASKVLESLDGRRNSSMNGHTLQAVLESPVMHASRMSKERKMSSGVDSTKRSPNPIVDQQHLQSQGQPITQQSQFVRTRIRTSFDPELELPKLHKWFAENQHPSRGQIQLYVKELNSLESRRGRKPLDINNVVYWFKNARAAHKRQELKFVNGSSSGIGNGNDSDNNNDSQGRNDGHRSESNGKMSHAQYGEGDSGQDDDDSGDDRTEDDNSSQFSHTLDLSNKRRRRSDSLDSDNHIPIVGSDSLYKEEAMSDEEEDDDVRGGSSDNGMAFDKLYGQSHGSSGLPFYATANGSPVGSNLAMNGQSGLPYGIYGSHSSSNHSNNKVLSGGNNGNNNPESPDNDSRRIRRSRTFIDPMTEVPRLEQWFSVNTHPTHSQIVRYTDELNRLQYRMKFPKLEPKNIQFWFKNRRAKFKRLSLPVSSHGPSTPSSSTHSLGLSCPSSTSGGHNMPPASSSPITSCGPNASPVTSSSPSSLNSSPKSQGNILGVSSSSIISSSPHSQSGVAVVTSALNIDRLIGN